MNQPQRAVCAFCGLGLVRVTNGRHQFWAHDAPLRAVLQERPHTPKPLFDDDDPNLELGEATA